MKFLKSIILLLVLMAAMGPVAAQSTIPLMINGKAFSSQGVLVENRVKVPLRAVAESLDIKVEWEGKDKSITLTKGKKQVKLQIGSYTVRMGEQERYIDQPAELIQNVTYVPLRVVSEALGYAVKWDNTKRAVRIDSYQENRLQITAKRIRYENEYVITDFQYPVVSGLSNPSLQSAINHRLMEVMLAMKKTAENVHIEDVKALRQHIPEVKYFYGTNYRVMYNQQGWLSVVIESDLYEGGAHGLRQDVALTFDLTSGEEIRLSDLFRHQTSYAEDISLLIHKRIPTSRYVMSAFEGIAQDHRNFYLSNEGALVIYFDLYEYTSYAEGMPQFSIPFNELTGWQGPKIKEESEPSVN